MKHALHVLPATTQGSGDSELLRRIADSIDGLREDLRSALAALASQSNGADVDKTANATDSGAVLMSKSEVCEMLQVSERTLQRLCHEDDAPQPFKIGSSLRWRRKDVDRWVAKRAG